MIHKGTRVRGSLDPISGVVEGHIENQPHLVAVKLDKGFYNKDESIFIRVLLVHESNLRVEGGE